MKFNLPKKTGTRVTDFLAAIGLKQYATDADPEDIVDAVQAMAEERAQDEGEQDPPNPAPAADDAADPAVAALSDKVDKLTDLVTKLISNGGQRDEKPEDAIDAAIAELEGQSTDGDEEESHTIPTEAMDDEGPVTDPADRPKSAMDSNRAIADALRAIKPFITAIPDPVQRKQATDAALDKIRGGAKKNTYGDMTKRQKPANDQKPAADGKATDHSQLGKDIAKQYNPHYKNRA